MLRLSCYNPIKFLGHIKAIVTCSFSAARVLSGSFRPILQTILAIKDGAEVNFSVLLASKVWVTFPFKKGLPALTCVGRCFDCIRR